MANLLTTEYQELIWDWTWDRLKVDRLQQVEERFQKDFSSWSIYDREKLTRDQGADEDIPIYTGSLGLVIDQVLSDTYQNWNITVDGTTESVLSEEYIELVGGDDIEASISGLGTSVSPYLITFDSTYIPDINPGTEQGQMSFWDNSLLKWVHTEIDELLWDDINKNLGINESTPLYKMDIGGKLRIQSIDHEITDVDKFLVSNNGVVKYRTGSEIVNDIGVLTDVDASNISSVIFTKGDGTEIIESFSHSHTEYALYNHHARHEIGGDDEIDIDGGTF